MAEQYAFPETRESQSSSNHGMTLRDWFAGQALANLTAASDVVARASWTENPEAYVAGFAYRLADAMLAERERQS